MNKSHSNKRNNQLSNKIYLLGHPILSNPSSPVEDILSDETQTLIKSLLTTVEQAGGVGIAAPQIGIPKRLFIVCSKPNNRYPNAPRMQPTAIINPKIIGYKGDIIEDWEGCLSVPSLRGLVARHNTIDVEYYDIDGQKHLQEFNGFIARIFQHEIDHLNGISFVDRVSNNKNLISEEEWKRQYCS
ncbi:peptide deformylase [Thalassotalea profundi]|uniref:Peptide deformylase n=1 Tax=Thalassotalea profundi TaxID=2036687 RepID=A0ABQ3IBT0_9GAMM|nr:peptide deformylase [Thalassotalea profundi]GHE78161.1 peptide deformylase [Thalassotalea profundi]